MIFRLFTMRRVLNVFIRRAARKILNPRKTEKYGTVAKIEISTIIKSKVFHQPAPLGSLAVKKSFPNAMAFNTSSITKIKRQIWSMMTRMFLNFSEMEDEVSSPRQIEFMMITKMIKYSKNVSASPSTRLLSED